MNNDFVFRELTEREYADFVSNKDANNFLQSIYAFKRYEQNNRESHIVGLCKGKKIIIAGLVVKIQELYHHKIFSFPYGPIMDYSDKNIKQALSCFTKEVKKYLKSIGGSVLQISPYTKYNEALTDILKSLGYKNLGEYIYPKWISTLDISAFDSPEALLKTFRKGHRYSVKYAKTRYNIEIRQLKKSELNILFNEVKMASIKHDFTAQDQSYYESMFDAFGDKIKVLAAFYEKKPVAAAMFVIYGKEVVYLYSGADPEYAKTCGSYALQWHMLNYCLDNDFPRYNFYGTHPSEDDGVYQFKTGFRAQVEELQGSFILPLDAFGKLYSLRKKYHKFSQIA